MSDCPILSKEETIRIPIRATYVIENGKAVRVSAEYADISVDALARFIARGFGIPLVPIDQEAAP